MSLLIFIFMSTAEVQTLLTATSSKEIETQHRHTTQQTILRERCDVELREKWIPLYCFEWLRQSTFTPPEKRVYQDFFNQRCIQAAANESTAAWKMFRSFKIKKGPCFTAVQQKYRDQMYQGQKTAHFSEMAQMIQVGREFELSTGHGEQKTPKSGRLRNHQLHR